MKSIKLMSLFLISLFFVSCALGKNVFISRKPVGEESGFGEEEILEDADDTESYLSAGIEKLRNRENEAAAVELKKALILDPGSADAYYYLALAEQRMGRLDRATEGYRAALKNDPEFYEALFNLGAVYAVQKKYNLAMEEFNKALEIYPGDADLYYNKALCFDQSGKRDEAITEYKKATQIEPAMVDAYLRLATLYELMGMHSEAMDEYRKVLKVAPDTEEAKKELEKLSSREKEREKKEVAKAEKTPQPSQPVEKSQPQPAQPPEEQQPEESQPEEGKVKKWLKIPKVALAKAVSWPKKIFQSDKEQTVSDGEFKNRFHFSLDNKFVTKKDISVADNNGENTLDSKRAIAHVGYAPDILNIFNLKDTQVYFNLGAVSMGLSVESQVECEKAMSIAYGAGVSSNIYNLPAYNLGVNLNLDYLVYSPEFENKNTGETFTTDMTEYQLAADTIYKGFNKFSPYFGLLYSKTSGSFDSPIKSFDFDEESSLGCRIGTGYNWQKNLTFSGEYRLLDENALSLSVNYVF